MIFVENKFNGQVHYMVVFVVQFQGIGKESLPTPSKTNL